MNTKQLSDWNQLVRQCKTQCARRSYNSINVASIVRSEAIVAADALVELVTPELAALLERLASYTKVAYEAAYELSREYDYEVAPNEDLYTKDENAARATAARIREALEEKPNV